MVEAPSARLVTLWFANPLFMTAGLKLPLPGEGIPGATLLSFSLDRLMFFGLEKSFIFELLLFASFSPVTGSGGGTGALGELCCTGGREGEGNGLLPVGKTTLAAVVAANLFPPTVPFAYDKPPAD